MQSELLGCTPELTRSGSASSCSQCPPTFQRAHSRPWAAGKKVASTKGRRRLKRIRALAAHAPTDSAEAPHPRIHSERTHMSDRENLQMAGQGGSSENAARAAPSVLSQALATERGVKASAARPPLRDVEKGARVEQLALIESPHPSGQLGGVAAFPRALFELAGEGLHFGIQVVQEVKYQSFGNHGQLG